MERTLNLIPPQVVDNHSEPKQESINGFDPRSSRLDFAAKQQILKVGGILLIIAGLGALGWSQYLQVYVAACNSASNGQCYTSTLFAELFGFLTLCVGGVAQVISKQLPKLENDWSLPKEERMALRRMPRDQWRAYWSTDDEETRKKIMDAELQREHKKPSYEK